LILHFSLFVDGPGFLGFDGISVSMFKVD